MKTMVHAIFFFWGGGGGEGANKVHSGLMGSWCILEDVQVAYKQLTTTENTITYNALMIFV